MIWPIPFDAAHLMHDPVRAIEAAHQSSAPPNHLTFIIPPRTWDYGSAGQARITAIIKAPNGLARLSVTRRGACVEIVCGLTMLALASGSTWLWLHNGRKHRKLWLWPDSDVLSTRAIPARRWHFTGLEAAHAELIVLYRSFGLVWTGDQSIPDKPRRMNRERYDRLVARIRAQWDVLSGSQPNG